MRTLVAVVLMLLSAIPPVFAHMLKTDGDIGVLMHVDPNDEPVQGEKASFYFEIKDRTGRFTSAGCDCRLRVFSGQKQIADEAAQATGTSPGSGAAAAWFVFPAAGIFRIELAGTPAKAAFSAFKVSFDLRVERGDSRANALSGPWLAFVIVVAALLLAAAAWAIVRIIKDVRP